MLFKNNVLATFLCAATTLHVAHSQYGVSYGIFFGLCDTGVVHPSGNQITSILNEICGEEPPPGGGTPIEDCVSTAVEVSLCSTNQGPADPQHILDVTEELLASPCFSTSGPPDTIFFELCDTGVVAVSHGEITSEQITSELNYLCVEGGPFDDRPIKVCISIAVVNTLGDVQLVEDITEDLLASPCFLQVAPMSPSPVVSTPYPVAPMSGPLEASFQSSIDFNSDPDRFYGIEICEVPFKNSGPSVVLVVPGPPSDASYDSSGDFKWRSIVGSDLDDIKYRGIWSSREDASATIDFTSAFKRFTVAFADGS